MQRAAFAVVLALALGGAGSPEAGQADAAVAAGQQAVPPEASQALRKLLVAAGFEPEDAGNGIWGITVPVSASESLRLGVSSHDGLAVVQCIIARDFSPADMDSAVALLRWSYNADLAKIGLTEDGRLQALHETELRTLDAEALKRIIGAVRDLADGVIEDLERGANTERPPLEGPPAGAKLQTLRLLGGRMTVDFDREHWREVNKIDGDPIFEHSSGLRYVRVISEAIQIPPEGLLAASLANARRADPRARETARGSRVVNGVPMLVLEFDASIDGIEFSFLGHYYVDAKGAVQILGWARREHMNDSRERIESFVSGFRVRR